MSEKEDEPKKIRIEFLIKAEIKMCDQGENTDETQPSQDQAGESSNKDMKEQDIYEGSSFSMKKHYVDAEIGKKALAALFSQPDKEHLRPDKMLERIRETAKEAKESTKRTHDYLRNICE